MNQTWNQLWAQHFRELTPEDIAIWEYEIFDGPSRIRGASHEDLLVAIRTLSTMKGRPAYPKLGHLQMTLVDVINRKAKESEASAVRAQGPCHFCRNGWMTYPFAIRSFAEEHVPGFANWGRPGYFLYWESIPCVCLQGLHELHLSYSQYEAQYLKERAKKVAGWLDTQRNCDAETLRTLAREAFDANSKRDESEVVQKAQIIEYNPADEQIPTQDALID